MNVLVTVFLLFLLLLMTIAPFSLLSGLLLVILLSGVLWMGWTLVRTAAQGERPSQE